MDPGREKCLGADAFCPDCGHYLNFINNVFIEFDKDLSLYKQSEKNNENEKGECSYDGNEFTSNKLSEG